MNYFRGFYSFNNENKPFELNKKNLDSVTIFIELFKWNSVSVNKNCVFVVVAAAVIHDLFGYFFRFFIGGKPLSNSDVDKLIDFETNLPKPVLLPRLAAGRFIPFFFTIFGSVARSIFLLADLWREERKNTPEIEISVHFLVCLVIK